MAKEMDPVERRALNDAERELERIRDKYLKNRILDDGRIDALEFASVEHRYRSKSGNNFHRRRWYLAISEATDDENPSWERMRFELKEEGKGFIETEKRSGSWEDYGLALLNLADSI